MFNSRAIVFFACATLGGAPAVRAQTTRPFSFELGGGASFLAGNDRTFYHDGYHVQAGISIPVSAVSRQLSLGANVFYNSFRGKGVSDQTVPGGPDTLRLGNFSVLAGTVSARWLFIDPTPVARGIAPYLTLGGGVYRIESEAELYGRHVSGSDTKPGATMGLGLAFPLAGTSAFVEARVHDVFTEGGSAKLYPLTFGIRF
jgi:hypothetical protein